MMRDESLMTKLGMKTKFVLYLGILCLIVIGCGEEKMRESKMPTELLGKWELSQIRYINGETLVYRPKEEIYNFHSDGQLEVISTSGPTPFLKSGIYRCTVKIGDGRKIIINGLEYDYRSEEGGLILSCNNADKRIYTFKRKISREDISPCVGCDNDTLGQVTNLIGIILYNVDLERWMISVADPDNYDNVFRFFPCNLDDIYKIRGKNVMFSGMISKIAFNTMVPHGMTYQCINLTSIQSYDRGYTSEKINGIVCQLNLLNEQGVPATEFNQGENFTFYFQIKNETGKKLYYDPYECAYTDDFFAVFDSTGCSMGKSYECLTREAIGIGAYRFKEGAMYILRQHGCIQTNLSLN